MAVFLLVALLTAPAVGVGAQSPLDEARTKAAQAAERSDEARVLAGEAEQEVLDSVLAIESANGRLLLIESDLVLLARRITVAEDERTALFDEVQRYAVQSYVNQEDNGVGWLVGSELTAGAERDVFIDLISGTSVDTIDRYRVVTQDLDIAQGAQAVLLDTQNDVLVVLQGENQKMDASLAVANAHLDEIEAQEAIFQAELAKLEEEERRRIEEARRKAEAERKRKEEAARAKAEQERQQQAEEERKRQEEEREKTGETIPDGSTDGETTTTTTTPPEPPVIIGDGNILCPIGGATHFTDTYGAARSGGRRHAGTDMFASRGTPVVAPVGGSVRQSNSRLGGLGFWLSGDDGNVYFGSHMDSFGSTGRVSAGTVIGTVGNTGNARFTSPHLHFEIHPGGGGARNPYPTVRSACG